MFRVNVRAHAIRKTLIDRPLKVTLLNGDVFEDTCSAVEGKLMKFGDRVVVAQDIESCFVMEGGAEAPE